MKTFNELERYFLISEFEEGWGMEDIQCEEQLLDYCIEALYIPEEKIEDVNEKDRSLEVTLCDLEVEDIAEDWYINLVKSSKE